MRPNPNPLLPDTIDKTFFTSAERQIVNSVRNHTLETCRFKISESYIKQAFNKFRKGFVYKENDSIVGLCIWRERVIQFDLQKNGTKPPDEKRMDILLLCSTANTLRLGTRILEDIDSYCIDKSIEYVDLEPADDDTMIFYEKNGYRLTSLNYEKKRILSKFIQSYKIRQNRSGSTRRVKRDNKNHSESSRPLSKFMTREEFFSLSPEEARRVMNYNVDLSNAVPRSP